MTDRPLLVAIDTATNYAGLAIYDGDAICSASYWRANRNHSVEVMPRLARMLRQQSVMASDLSAVAVVTGPGSFTGLRIGLSIAKGLAVACDIPILGVPTLDILAFQHADQRRPIWAVIQAGRSRLCVARYERRRGRWRQRGEIHLTTLEQFPDMISGRCLVCGELCRQEMAYIVEHSDQDIVCAIPSQSMRRPSCLAELAWRRFEQGESDDVATLSPIYIHPQLS
jgi:tRNA threonylcarbamoyladenosine biosynthesis protein TsaB